MTSGPIHYGWRICVIILIGLTVFLALGVAALKEHSEKCRRIKK
jgi:hypothetical protein